MWGERYLFLGSYLGCPWKGDLDRKKRRLTADYLLLGVKAVDKGWCILKAQKGNTRMQFLGNLKGEESYHQLLVSGLVILWIMLLWVFLHQSGPHQSWDLDLNPTVLPQWHMWLLYLADVHKIYKKSC